MPRPSGACSAGFATTDGVGIDLSGIRYASVDPARRLARVGAGTRFDELNSVLDVNRLHVPGGACGEVGIGGFVHWFRPGGPCYGCVASYFQRSLTIEKENPPDYSQPGGPVAETTVPVSVSANGVPAFAEKSSLYAFCR